MKASRLRVKIEKVMKDLPEDLCDLVMRNQDRVRFWLEALPLEESDFVQAILRLWPNIVWGRPQKLAASGTLYFL